MTRSTESQARKVDWEETCSKCVYGSPEKVKSNAKGRCTHKNPDTLFDFGRNCWMCLSFVRRWDTTTDLHESRDTVY